MSVELNIPSTPISSPLWIYCFSRNGKIYYIGQTNNPKRTYCAYGFKTQLKAFLFSYSKLALLKNEYCEVFFK